MVSKKVDFVPFVPLVPPVPLVPFVDPQGGTRPTKGTASGDLWVVPRGTDPILPRSHHHREAEMPGLHKTPTRISAWNLGKMTSAGIVA